ncbi:MAG: energy-coupling factor ABC transporter ATP-binding protein [Oscillospiraceae bacterium]|nr:energy-coupling factor ABC transporter ATP-binding protein [Oscillospiraceae bacterium]
MNAVEVKNLSFSYGNGKPVLRDVSFSVSPGEIFVIAGLSGSGKTTLCNILCGVIPHAVKGEITGEVTVANIKPAAAGLSETALRAGMVFQDADSQIICTTVEDELAFGPENLCMPPDEIRRAVDEMLAEFGLGEVRDLDPARLSGGEKKLLTIASALILDPPVLILDEPMSGLDEEGRIQVRTAIEKQRSRGKTVITVEHDLKLVTYADRWLLLKDGGVAACDTPDKILSRENLLSELRLLP